MLSLHPHHRRDAQHRAIHLEALHLHSQRIRHLIANPTHQLLTHQLGRQKTLAAIGNLILIEQRRSEEHTSELQSLMRISYAVFCLTKKKKTKQETKQVRVTIRNTCETKSSNTQVH